MANDLFAPPTKKELKKLSALDGLKEKADQMMSYTFKDSGRSASPGEGLDSWTGAPVRRAIYDYQSGKGLLDSAKAGLMQAGRDPLNAPTGEMIVRKAGIENKYAAPVLGFGVDVLADASLGAGLLRKGAVPLMGAVKKIKSSTAQDILNKIDTPEKAIALKGSERAEYLKALDEVYGDRAKRAKDLGFDQKQWYHGSKQNLEKFYKESPKEHFGESIWGPGVYVTDSPKVAEGYAVTGIGKSGPIMPLKIRGGKDAVNLNLVDTPEKFDLTKNAIFRNNQTDSVNQVVRDPSAIRSTNAAFDPRFKDSDYLLAGGIGSTNLNGINMASKSKKDLFAPPSEDEMNALFAPPNESELNQVRQRQPFPGEGYVRGALKTLPTVGAVAGGLLSGGTTFGAATYPGAVLGAGAGKGLQNFLEGQIFDEAASNAQNIKNISDEMAFAGAGEAIIPGLSAVGRGAKGLIKGTAEKVAPGVMNAARSRFDRMLKPNAELIQESANRLGTRATEGMVSQNPVRQGIESSLSQSPYATGNLIRGEYDDVVNKMREGAQTVLKPGMDAANPIDAARMARESMTQTVESRVKPAVEIYDAIAGDATAVALEPKSMGRIANNIRKGEYAWMEGTTDSAVSEMVAKNLEKAQNLQQLRQLKTKVGQDLAVAKGSERFTLGQIYDKLQRAERTAILRASEEALTGMKNTKDIPKRMAQDIVQRSGEGQMMGREMIGQIKKANKIYREVSQSVKALAKEMGLGNIKNYNDFLVKLSQDSDDVVRGALTDENIYKKFWSSNNYRGLQAFQKEFPQAFEAIKTAKMGEIYNKAMKDGKVNYGVLIRESEKMSPQVRTLLFGKDGDTIIKDLKTLNEAFPPKMGPSGTPQGQEYRDFGWLSPKDYINEGRRMIQYWVLKNPEKAARLKLRSVPLNKSKRLAISQGLFRPAIGGLLQDEGN